MGSAAHSLPAINRLIMRNGPILSQQQKIALCAEVIEREIYAGMCAIDGYLKHQELMVTMPISLKRHG